MAFGRKHTAVTLHDEQEGAALTLLLEGPISDEAFATVQQYVITVDVAVFFSHPTISV